MLEILPSVAECRRPRNTTARTTKVFATPDFPTFMEIAEAAEDNLIVLVGFLVDPHPPMPDLSLTRQEIGDLIGYFATLR